MRAPQGDDGDFEPLAGSSRAELSGSAADVVQARNVHGGVHFHRASRSSETAPQQLPGENAGFINRVGDIRVLDGLLTTGGEQPTDPVAIVVIAGTAGVGKTSLALHWAHRVCGSFPDGQLYVNLRGYDPGEPVHPSQALERFLRALGVPPTRISADVEEKSALYRSKLAGRRFLVFLDNAASVAQVRPLLPGTANCLVVVTSRSRLSGLVARDGARRVTLDTLNETESVSLLRAATADYRHGDDERDLEELARLCAQLPLALRIAAERAASRPWMPMQELIRDLRDESALWDALTSEDGEESDAVRTVFAWSYRALSQDSARLFRLLGLHPGADFSTEAAAALTGADGAGRIRNLLDVLVGAHLLEETASGRYQFHDLLRAYAVDQVNHEETSDNRRAALRRLLLWYLHTADSAASTESRLRRVQLDPLPEGFRMLSFDSYPAALRWYEVEQENLAAATRAAAQAGYDRISWHLHAVLRTIYSHQNPFADWLSTGRIALSAARRLGDRQGEAEILYSLGMAHTQSQNLPEGLTHHMSALAIRREIGDRFGEAMSMNGIGLLHLRSRRLGEAAHYFEECRSIFEDLRQKMLESISLANLAEAFCEMERYAEATDYLSRAIPVFRAAGDIGNEGNTLQCLSRVLRRLGRTDEALENIQSAMDIAHRSRNRMWEGYWLLELGQVQLSAARPEEALTSYQRAAVLQRGLGDRSREAQALDGAGGVYQHVGQFDQAADFHRRAAAVHRELNDDWRLAESLDHLASALAALGEADEARRLWREVVDRAQAFDDAASVRMRGLAQQRLAGQ